jgi:hypothetical protein
MLRWWIEVLSASCYEGQNERGKAHMKIYQLPLLYIIFGVNACFVAFLDLLAQPA